MVSFVPVSPIIRADDLQSHPDDDNDKNNNRNSRTIIIRGGCVVLSCVGCHRRYYIVE